MPVYLGCLGFNCCVVCEIVLQVSLGSCLGFNLYKANCVPLEGKIKIMKTTVEEGLSNSGKECSLGRERGSLSNNLVVKDVIQDMYSHNHSSDVRLKSPQRQVCAKSVSLWWVSLGIPCCW